MTFNMFLGGIMMGCFAMMFLIALMFFVIAMRAFTKDMFHDGR